MAIHYVIDRDGTVRDTGRDRRGCVVGSTKVYLENGKKVEISKVKSTDRLTFIENDSDPVVLSRVSGLEHKKIVKISTETGKSIVATENHPFYKDGFLNKASEFKVSEMIDTIDGKEIITSIERFNTKEKVFNVILGSRSAFNSELELESYLRKYPFQELPALGHRLVLNGFISGDLIIQKVQR